MTAAPASSPLRRWLPAAVAIFGLALISLWMRPPLPLDETRYLAVAWEMHGNGDWLVPHLNGRPYSQKPPLLFWMINAGWNVFGVNSWWPRLLPALAVMATFGLVLAIRRRLPQSPRQHPSQAQQAQPFHSPLPLLVGSLAWALYSTVLLFDMFMAMFATLGWLGIVLAWQRKIGGWLFVALAMGFGILCKGPVILLYVLPAALLAPLLARDSAPAAKSRTRRWLWYAQLFFAVSTAAAIALAWAIPAANQGGQAYADDILWGQTAGRVQNSFSHDHPWWWYFPILLALFIPWVLMPSFWRALRCSMTSRTQRWLMYSALLPFVIFMLMSGKQPHYLIPLMPLVALALSLHSPPTAAGIARSRPGLQNPYLPFALPGLLGITLLALPNSVLAPFRVETMAGKIHQLQQQQIPVLHAGKYHGDFHFVGRLEQALHVRKDVRKIPAWAAEHPNGYLVISDRHAARSDFIDQQALQSAVYEQPYRSGKLYLIALADEIASPPLPADPAESN